MPLDPSILSPKDFDNLKAASAGVTALYLTRWLEVSATTALVFDYFDTLEEERRFFWGGDWSWPRGLFFVNRYFAILVQLFNTGALLFPPASIKFCQFALVAFLPGTGLLEIFIVQAILCFRLNAMYNNNRRMLYSVVALFFFTSVGAIVALAHELGAIGVLHAVSTTPSQLTIAVCFAAVKVKNFWIVGVPVLVFDITAFCMAAYKALQQLTMNKQVNVSLSKELHVSGQVRTQWNSSRLMRVLIRHSLLYFVLISTIYAVNILIWRLLPVTEALVATGWSLTMLSIAGNRMLLSLRRIRAEDAERYGTITDVRGDDYFEFANLTAGFPAAQRVTGGARIGLTIQVETEAIAGSEVFIEPP